MVLGAHGAKMPGCMADFHMVSCLTGSEKDLNKMMSGLRSI